MSAKDEAEDIMEKGRSRAKDFNQEVNNSVS